MDFHIETDHKPLLPLLSTKEWVDIPPCIQRFKMRLMKYRFTISHVPGKLLITADTLSKKTLANCTEGDLENSTKAYVGFISGSLQLQNKDLKKSDWHRMKMKFVQSY